MGNYVSPKVELTFDEFDFKGEFDYSEVVKKIARDIEKRIVTSVLDYAYMKVDLNSCWDANFGTPERMAQTIIDTCCYDCKTCPFSSAELQSIPCKDDYGCEQAKYGEILAWLKGGAR